MSGRIHDTEEFKRDAVCQVSDRRYLGLDVLRRLGVSTKSMYGWIRRYNNLSSTISHNLH